MDSKRHCFIDVSNVNTVQSRGVKMNKKLYKYWEKDEKDVLNIFKKHDLSRTEKLFIMRCFNANIRAYNNGNLSETEFIRVCQILDRVAKVAFNTKKMR